MAASKKGFSEGETAGCPIGGISQILASKEVFGCEPTWLTERRGLACHSYCSWCKVPGHHRRNCPEPTSVWLTPAHSSGPEREGRHKGWSCRSCQCAHRRAVPPAALPRSWCQESSTLSPMLGWPTQPIPTGKPICISLYTHWQIYIYICTHICCIPNIS